MRYQSIKEDDYGISVEKAGIYVALVGEIASVSLFCFKIVRRTKENSPFVHGK